MVKELSYTTTSDVIESWGALRRTPNYEKVAGAKLFQSLFQRCPETKVLFGFPIDLDPESSELLSSKRFLLHASYFIEMLDTSLDMLGPDIELLTEIMYDFGKKHLRYGVKPQMFPHMGLALIDMLEKMLRDDFTDEIKDSWLKTYDALSQDMIRAQRGSK